MFPNKCVSRNTGNNKQETRILPNHLLRTKVIIYCPNLIPLSDVWIRKLMVAIHFAASGIMETDSIFY